MARSPHAITDGGLARGGSSSSVSSGTGLKTKPGELRQLLDKSGARHKLDGAEKLDLLVWLADQVRGSIEEKRRMKLTVHELQAMLAREGMSPETLDAKALVSGLLALRRREIARLEYESDRAQACQSTDQSFELALANMSDQQVTDCFELVAFTPDAPASQAPTQGSSTSRAHSGQPPPPPLPVFSNGPASSADEAGKPFFETPSHSQDESGKETWDQSRSRCCEIV
eukprot:TRINITY_DN57299_c0_g1_i1.p1 TRINITY_DN57299_c0_g1~~TRINITY_DN57299_c0_g1_i1.p1  ORF type:complete len:236 (-),score=40.56 TRINITY_DN57299_c0_g1_i1:180-863(-)